MELSNFDHVLCVVSQTGVFAGNWTHDPQANIAYPLGYQDIFFLNENLHLQAFSSSTRLF